ncbi:MAG: 4a-hydroxytetrahydrobiopterin dehydratase [Pyrinomonadaceae bacterium]|nr:4a-hydroxytetrahydrobiopterin dehydratase [Pyrinomonadaceae bacterium]
MSDNLASRACVPCHGGVPKLEAEEIKRLLPQLRGWEVSGGDHHLKKSYRFPNFRQALELVNRIAAIAEREGHHPDLRFGWGYCEVELYTHAIDGLSESDFILAAKFDLL